MSDDSMNTNGRASIASVDARVGRLEAAQAASDAQIAGIKMEQGHLRELVTNRFISLEATVAAQGTKLENFIGRMEQLILEATRNSGDLTASPVGRGVNDRLVKLEQTVDRHDSMADKWSGVGATVKWIAGVSGISLILALASLAKMAHLF